MLKDYSWLLHTQALSILYCLWIMPVMNIEKGIAQHAFISTKWGFKKQGPVGSSVLAGLSAEPTQSGLGEVNVQGLHAWGQLAGNFSSAFWWQNEVFHSECKWHATSNWPYWESNEENATLSVKTGCGLSRGSPLAPSTVCCLHEAGGCPAGACDEWQHPWCVRWRAVSPGPGGCWHHGRWGRWDRPVPLPAPPWPVVEGGVTSKANFKNIRSAECGLAFLFRKL